MEKESFGERMKRIRRLKIHRYEKRLWKALVRKKSKVVWNIKGLDEQLIGGIKTIVAMNQKAELKVENGEVLLYAVRYEPA